MENISLHPDKRFNRVIFWGHPLHTHTHSYIYAGFKKAFEYLGYQTRWYDGKGGEDDTLLNNALIFATGDQVKGLPINRSSYYVFHNVDAKKYYEYDCKILFLQTRPQNPDILTQNKNIPYEFFNPYTLLLKFPDVNCLYMNWATDLLPHEITETNIIDKATIDNPYFIWIGTYGDSTGEFQTDTNLMPYVNECKKNGIITKMINCWSTPISFEENRRLVRGAFLAPAIQGVWQVNNAYIPCRIFKNISYGNIGITNNPYVNELFENMLVYDNDSVCLFYKSIAARDSFYRDTKKHEYLMNEVRTKHTYLNRIEYILKCLPK